MNIPPINLKAQFKGVKKDILKGIREILDEQKLILGQYCLKLEEQVASMTGGRPRRSPVPTVQMR